MFEVMNTGFDAPIPKGLAHKYTFTVTEFPTSTFVQGLGSSESGDLVLSANSDARSVVYRKDANGVFKFNQSLSNSGATGGYPVPMPGGFVVSTPTWPNGRGALATWILQPDGTYLRTATPREAASPYGQLGSLGGLASIGNWLFAGVNFDGSILITFNKAGETWSVKNYVTKPGTNYFASNCIRALSPTEIVASSAYEQVSTKAQAGAVYVLNVTAAGAVEKQRIIPLVPYTNGVFGMSIIVINQNRIVVTGKTDAGHSNFYTFDRPTSSDPFVQVSVTTVATRNILSSNNFMYHKGLILGGNLAYNGSVGEIVALSIDTNGVVELLPDLSHKGTLSGQFFGEATTVIGNQLFVASSFRNDTSKYSTVSVYDINT